jgi:HEAT repeat protein
MRKLKHKYVLVLCVVGVAVLLVCLALWSPFEREWWYIRQLRFGYSHEQCSAARKLANLQSRRAVPHLIGLLKEGGHSRARVNCRAAEALGKIGDRRAVGPLIELMLKPEEEVPNGDRLRSSAAWALGKIGDHRAIESLLEVLGDTGYSVGDCACEALVELGLDANEVRRKRTNALLRILQDSSDPSLREKAADHLSRLRSPAVIAGLYKALADRVEDVREESHLSLVEMGEPEDKVADLRRKATLTFLADTSADARYGAVEGLCDVGKPEDVAVLVERLRDSDTEVRRLAAMALGRIGSPAAIPGLRVALRDRDRRLRERATLSLADLGDKSVIPDLKKLYVTYDDFGHWISDRLRKLGVSEAEINQAKADALKRTR